MKADAMDTGTLRSVDILLTVINKDALIAFEVIAVKEDAIDGCVGFDEMLLGGDDDGRVMTFVTTIFGDRHKCLWHMSQTSVAYATNAADSCRAMIIGHSVIDAYRILHI